MPHRLAARRTFEMRDWLTWLGLAALGLVGSWALLAVAARRLPPGLLRDLAAFIPDCVTTARRLRRDPRVPRRAKAAVLLAAVWLASPVDLLPEFLPVIGPLDDILVVALALRYAARHIPREILLEAWPGESRLLERLLGTTGVTRQPDVRPPNRQAPDAPDVAPDDVAPDTPDRPGRAPAPVQGPGRDKDSQAQPLLDLRSRLAGPWVHALVGCCQPRRHILQIKSTKHEISGKTPKPLSGQPPRPFSPAISRGC
jgi:uncharacterized membrane protein YkvA (DUF1232 family)